MSIKWVELEPKRWYYILHPRLTAVIASCAEGICSAMAASWITPVSRDPPYLAVAIAPQRFTYSLIEKSRSFSVNILPFTRVRELHYLGTVSAREEPRKLELSKLTWSRGRALDVPICLDSLAIAECTVEFAKLFGDHVLVVGHIKSAYVREDVKLCDPKEYRVVLHLGGSRYTKPSEEFIEIA